MTKFYFTNNLRVESRDLNKYRVTELKDWPLTYSMSQWNMKKKDKECFISRWMIKEHFLSVTSTLNVYREETGITECVNRDDGQKDTLPSHIILLMIPSESSFFPETTRREWQRSLKREGHWEQLDASVNIHFLLQNFSRTCVERMK